jgi:cytochrome c oxidase subunit 2
LPDVPRSRHAVPLIAIAVVVGAITAGVFFLIDWIPDQASKQAERVDPLMWFVVITSGVIFTIVLTFLLYSVFRFRAKDGDDEDGPPLHGNTKLEIAWTIVPTMLLAIMAVWAYLVLTDNEALAEDRMIVNVTAEQFAWTFTYPDAGIESGDLRIPVDRQVELRMTAVDVIHDLYVPEFRVKQDVVPGVITQLVVDPTRVGKYPVICAELCGLGHNAMRTNVYVMPQAQFDRWLTDAKRQVASGQPAQQEQPAGGAAGTRPEGAEQPTGDAAASQ